MARNPKTIKEASSSTNAVKHQTKTPFFSARNSVDQLQSWGHEDVGLADGNGRAAAEIYFKTDNAVLDSQDKKVLDKISRQFNTYMLGRKVNIILYGYADYRGSKTKNIFLAADRVANVKYYLEATLKKHSSNYNITFEAFGEVAGNKNEAGQRRVSIFFDSPGRKQKKEDKPKPDKVKIEEIEQIDPEKEHTPTIDETKKPDIVEVGVEYVSTVTKPAGLANALIGPTALGGGAAIAGQIAFIINGLIIIGEDAPKIHAEVAGAVYGTVIGAHNAAKVYASFKDNVSIKPSSFVKKWPFTMPALPENVPRESTFQNAVKKAYKSFIENTAEAFEAVERKKAGEKPPLTLAESRRRASKYAKADRNIAIINDVVRDPEGVLQKEVAINLQNALAKKHNVYWSMIRNGKYTYNFE
ncbi:MAG: OmpA family protein [Leeuwenhoekiella sp.]